MAIQNFISGGYYGKLGATVGQRWKNKRTIRSYVIPRNPRTPLQQANRKQFGGVVPFAQLGMGANYKSPAFDISENTEWAYRMSRGTELKRIGMTDLNLIPLYPPNFSIPHTVTTITLARIVTNNSVSFTIEGDTPTTARSFSVLLYFADGAREGEILLLIGNTTNANPSEIICNCENTSEIDTATIYARVCSNDDERIETITSSLRVPLQRAAAQDFIPDLSIYSQQLDAEGRLVTMLQTQNPYEDNPTGNVVFTFRNVAGTVTKKDGTTTTFTLPTSAITASYTNVGGNAGWLISQDIIDRKTVAKVEGISFDIQAAYNNFTTPSRQPTSTTVSVSYSTSWQNTQPTFILNPTYASVGTLEDGTAYIDFNVNMPVNYATCFSAQVAVVGTVSSKKGFSWNRTTNVFEEVFVNASTMGAWSVESAQRRFNTIRVTIKSNKWKEINSYNVTAQVKLIVTNAYDDDSMPLTTNFQDTARTMPTNWQPDTLRNIMQNASFTIGNIEPMEDGIAYCELTWNDQVRNLNVYTYDPLEEWWNGDSGVVEYQYAGDITIGEDDNTISLSMESDDVMPINNAYYYFYCLANGEEVQQNIVSMNVVGELYIDSTVLYCDTLKVCNIPHSNPIRKNITIRKNR